MGERDGCDAALALVEVHSLGERVGRFRRAIARGREHQGKGERRVALHVE